MKNIFLTLFIIIFFTTATYGACAITGGACSIEDLNPKLQKQTVKKEIKKTTKKEKIKIKNTKQKDGK
ncbi:hypothetical protein IKE67_01140 [bacterium]|nr:hypothetical protein [bacterium]